MQAPYIPSKDADFSLWLTNFSNLLTASPAVFGLTAGDAAIVFNSNSLFTNAYDNSSNPATRTSAAIAEKDAQRTAATATVRPYAVRISNNAAVSDLLKIEIGVNLPNSARTPVPPPTTAPTLAIASAGPGVHTLGYADVTTPASKRKPEGVIGMDLHQATGIAPAVDPSLATYLGTYNKSPLTVGQAAANAGKVATYFARWTTLSGPAGVAQKGPWSAPLSVTII